MEINKNAKKKGLWTMKVENNVSKPVSEKNLLKTLQVLAVIAVGASLVVAWPALMHIL